MPGAGKPAIKTEDDECKTKNKIVLTQQAERLAHVARIENIGMDAIASRLSAPGVRFRTVADDIGVPVVALWNWVKGDPARMQAYNDAVEAKAHGYVEEAHDLADRVVDGDLDPRRADVKIKLVQWTAARSQAYQERKTVEHTVTHKLDLDDLKQRLAQLVDVAGQRAPQQAIEADYTIVTPNEADTH